MACSLLFSMNSFALQNSPNSHREIIFTVTDSLVRAIAADYALVPAAVITLTMNDQPQNNYLRQQFIHSFIAQKLTITFVQNSADTILECNVRELSLQFGDVFSESFFGERKTERRITVSIDVTMRSTFTGKIFYSKNISKLNIDTVMYSMVNQLHDNSIPFTQYKEPQLSFFDSILEPAIITIASGIVVYLFFTIRS